MFKERFNQSISKLDAQRHRFNQTTQIPKKIQQINLPKNLDKISLEYQFTSSNRMNYKNNIKVQKEQQVISLNNHIHERTKNLENQDEIAEIIKNATIEKPPMIKQVPNYYRSRSTLNQTQHLRTQSLFGVKSPSNDFKQEITISGWSSKVVNCGLSTKDLNSPIPEKTKD